MRRPWLVGPIMLAACLGPRSDPSSFYLLNATLQPQQGAAMPVVLGLGPISLPGYLDRPQIVVRVGENEIALAESDRWAEPLPDNLARALEENLSALLPGASFVSYPWYASAAPDYGIEVQVRRFEADSAGEVVLDATWQITQDGGLIERRATLVGESAVGTDRASTVAALSRALGRLGGEIASGVRRAEAR
ncbi:MAG: PqiC family protein [Gemmatimonadota bacterium]|nr:PqiC family protein [Gemmatimonadota bacterium]